MKKINGKMVSGFCVELDKLDGMKKEDCKEQKTKVLQMARNLGFVVGKNGNHIEIHENTGYYNDFNSKTLLANMFVNNQLKLVVNSDHLWNIAEGMEIQENGDY